MDLMLLPGERGRTRRRARDAGDWPSIVVLAVVVAAALVAVCWSFSSERDAIRAIPAERREALLAQTVGELREFCGEGRPEGLRDHCRQLATFAAQFDACRGECEALVHRQLAPAPTR